MLFWIYENGYNLMLCMAGISGIALVVFRRQQYRLSVWQATALGLMLMLYAIAGAKLLYILENRGATDGMSLFGSVFLVLLCIPLTGRLFSLSGSEALDACSPCGAAIIGFVRFGCYIAGCCGGIHGTIGGRVFQWPTQLMESFCDLMIVLYLLHAEKKEHRPGYLYALFLILYCSSRFMIEFLRDTPKNWLGLSHGQWFSLIGFTLGWLVLFCTKVQKEAKYETRKKRK